MDIPVAVYSELLRKHAHDVTEVGFQFKWNSCYSCEREEEWVSGARGGMNGMYIFHQENASV